MWVCVAHVLSMQAMNFFASSNSQSDGTERALRFYDAGSSFRFFSSSICCCSYLPASSLSYERKFIERWKTISHCIAYTFIPRFGAWHTENKRQTSDNPVVPRFSSASPFVLRMTSYFYLSITPPELHTRRNTHNQFLILHNIFLALCSRCAFHIRSCFCRSAIFSHFSLRLRLHLLHKYVYCVLNLMTTYDMPQVSSSTSQRFIS